MKIRIQPILDIIIYVGFYIIIWTTTWNLTLGFIKQQDMLSAIQMKNIQIMALTRSCKECLGTALKVNWLIEQVQSNSEGRE